MSDNLAKIKRSSQAIDNFSFDEDYLKSIVIPYTENAEGTAISPQKAIMTEETGQAILAASGGGFYDKLIDEGATYSYVGKATPGTLTSEAKWLIKRITEATGNEEYASSSFNQIWDNRVSLF